MNSRKRREETAEESSGKQNEKFWRLARKYERPHIEILKTLYTQDQHALVTKEVYQKTSLDISDRQKRNIFQELDEDDLLDYTEGKPALLVKKQGFEEPVNDLIRVWNEVNQV